MLLSRRVDIGFGLDARAAEAGCLVALHIFATRTGVESSGTSVFRAAVSALVFLVGVELCSMNRLDVFSERTGIRVPLGTTRGFANVGFLKKIKNKLNIELIQCVKSIFFSTY